MKNKHKHQFFEINKITKECGKCIACNPPNLPAAPDMCLCYYSGVLIMCSCGERRKLWHTGEVEIIKNENE